MNEKVRRKHIVYLGIGSNLDDRVEYIKEAKRLLSDYGTIVACSSLYETAAQEAPGIIQGNFLNIVVSIETEFSVNQFFDCTQKIEQVLGRERTIKNGPRTIDIDILFYDDMVVDTANLTIPHPRMHLRNFVLVPFAEIASQVVHPVLQKSIEVLKTAVDTHEWIQKYDI